MPALGKNIAAQADEDRIAQLEPGFLQNFAACRLQGRFAGLYPAPRQLPFEVRQSTRAFAKQHPFFIRYDNGDAAGHASPARIDKPSRLLARFLNSMVYCRSIVKQLPGPQR